MSQFRFLIPERLSLDPRVWESAYISGIEAVPWQSRGEIRSGQFTISRGIDESGRLNILWPTSPYGWLGLATCSFPCNYEPLSLPVELARGCIHQLKTQQDQWQRVGLLLPDQFYTYQQRAVEALLRSVSVARDDPQEQFHLAQLALRDSLISGQLMSQAYARQALEARRRIEGPLTTLVGVSPTDESAWKAISGCHHSYRLLSIDAHLGRVQTDSGRIDWDWIDQQIDFAAAHDLRVCMGPLVDFSALPQWMLLLDQSVESVCDIACKYVEKVVKRYQGKVHLWNCFSGLNLPTPMGWSDAEILTAAQRIGYAVRSIDPHHPALISVSEPWGEYLRTEESAISPIHFADDLVRADLGISGLVLELDIGKWPGGTYPRPPLEFHRLIDRWSQLGMPLMVSLTYHYDPETSIFSWPPPSAMHSADQPTAPFSPARLVRNLVAKPSVHVVVWRTGTRTHTGRPIKPGARQIRDLQVVTKEFRRLLDEEILEK